MNVSTITLSIIAVGMAFVAFRRGKPILAAGLEISWATFKRTAVLLLLAFSIVGFINVLSPQDLVREWIGPGSGIVGVLIGAGMGMLLPGGPYVVFPLIASIYEAGAGIGPTLAVVTSWASLALLSVSFEIPFLGWRFSALRLSLGVSVPVLVGIAGQLLFGQ
jgi:uncharacterized membrane protein YraQ (UPF0718 family)